MTEQPTIDTSREAALRARITELEASLETANGYINRVVLSRAEERERREAENAQRRAEVAKALDILERWRY